jgi:phage protein D
MGLGLRELRERHGDFYAPRFRVEVGGRTFTDATGVLSDLSVDTTMEGADRFSFTANYPFDHSNARFEGFDLDDFAPGTSVKMWLGYGERLDPEPATAGPAADPAFVGKVSSVKTDFPSSGTPSVAISGFDLLHDMTKGTKERSWEETTVSDVVAEVAGEYFGKKVEVDETGLKPDSIVQDRKNDLQFLATEIGEKYGFEVFARRDEFFFKTKDRRKRPGEPVVVLRYGESLSSFSPELNDAEQVKTVEVRHWDPAKKDEIVGTAEQEEGSGKLVLRRTVQSADMATSVAEAELNRVTESFVSGSGETIGIPEIRAGVTVRIEGVTERFSRDYLVEQATHSLGGSGYTTSFRATERPK